MRWLVDGYNVMFSDSKLAALLRTDNETGRRVFLERILFSGRFAAEEVTVVFDGRFAPSSVQETSKLTTVFTARGESADDYIKREVGKSHRRRSLIVVSDDLAIVGYARECGAKAMGSREFLEGLRERSIPSASALGKEVEKPEPTGKVDPELLKLFSGKEK